MAKRLVITKEKHEVILIRQATCQEISFCNECEKEVLWLSIKEAAEFSKMSELHLFRQIESQTIHYRETIKGVLLICLNSITDDK